MRVFLSYSSNDYSEAKKIVKILKQNRIEVFWSDEIAPGEDFYSQIPFYIEQAHVFVPLLSKESKSGWVNQEIGYAFGLNIPVIPVCIDDVDPIGFMGKLHAIKLSMDPLERLQQLKENVFKKQVQKHPAIYKRAAVMETRAKMLYEYSDKLTRLDKYGCVRQKGGLSSFHIPSKHVDSKVWHDRYYPEKRPRNHKELQRNERIALEKHAQIEGCKLIINPRYVIEGRSVISAKSRIEQLISFLESMSDEKVVVAMENIDKSVESLTLVGDYFLAESVSFKDGDGFTNTFFTRNVGEILKRIETFDDELNDLLEQFGWNKSNSKQKAIEELKRMIKNL